MALPNGVDPQTLETTCYDPFKQVKSKTFTAHPKYDPYRDELVVFGYEARGLGTTDIVTYSVDRAGNIKNEFWTLQLYDTPGFIHDCAITPNWHVLFVWPFEADIARMKRGGHHWAWVDERGITFIVIPRDATNPKAAGWQREEVRSYDWKTCMPIHTAGAWEDDQGHILVDSSRLHDNAPFFPPDTDEPRMPDPNTKADYVRWRIDPVQPDRSYLPDRVVILDCPSEFPRIDERFMTSQYDYFWLNVFIPERSDESKNIFHGLNGLAMHSNKTGKMRKFYVRNNSLVQEPIFIPRPMELLKATDGWLHWSREWQLRDVMWSFWIPTNSRGQLQLSNCHSTSMLNFMVIG